MDIPNSRAMSIVMPERVSFSSSKSFAVPSMPSSSMEAAWYTARCGTDTNRTMSAKSSREPSSHPVSGKRFMSPASSVKTQ